MNKKELNMTKEELVDRMIEKAKAWKIIAESKDDEKIVLDLYDMEDLLCMLELVQLKGSNFLDDREKMSDFRWLSKEKFLESYSYLTEEEYDNTKLLQDAKDATFYRKWNKSLSEEVKKLKDAISHGNWKEMRDGEWPDRKDNLEYLFVVQEAWGDRTFYFDRKTHDVVSTWFSIGD